MTKSVVFFLYFKESKIFKTGDIPNEEAVMDMLYHDDDTTSDNISNLMKSAHRSKDVILAISNLYLRQQIIFERI